MKKASLTVGQDCSTKFRIRLPLLQNRPNDGISQFILPPSDGRVQQRDVSAGHGEAIPSTLLRTARGVRRAPTGTEGRFPPCARARAGYPVEREHDGRAFEQATYLAECGLCGGCAFGGQSIVV